MLYTAAAFLVLGLLLLVLNLVGVIKGAAGLVNLSLIAGFLLLAGKAISEKTRNRYQT